MNFFVVVSSAAKSTPGWFSRKPSKAENNGKLKKEEEAKDEQESIAEGSSESEVDRLLTKREKSSDEDEMKTMANGERTEASDEVSAEPFLSPELPSIPHPRVSWSVGPWHEKRRAPETEDLNENGNLLEVFEQLATISQNFACFSLFCF